MACEKAEMEQEDIDRELLFELACDQMSASKPKKLPGHVCAAARPYPVWPVLVRRNGLPHVQPSPPPLIELIIMGIHRDTYTSPPL